MRVLPGKAGDQPVPSVAWTGGDPGCEAYTGGMQAALISLESHVFAGADAVGCAEGNIGTPLRQVCRSRRGL